MNKINCPHCQTTAIENADELAAGTHEFNCQECQRRFNFTIMAAPVLVVDRDSLLILHRSLSMLVAETTRLLEEEK